MRSVTLLILSCTLLSSCVVEPQPAVDSQLEDDPAEEDHTSIIDDWIGQPCGPCADGSWGSEDGSLICRDASECPNGDFVLIEPGEFHWGSLESELGHMPGEFRQKVIITRPFFIQRTETTQAQWERVMGDRPSFFSPCGADCPVEQVTFGEILDYLHERSLLDGLKPCYTCYISEHAMGTDEFAISYGNGEHEPITCEKASRISPGSDRSGKVYLERYFDICDGYRLPTEAEWEFVARAGTTTATFVGNLKDVGCEDKNMLTPFAHFCQPPEASPLPVASKLPNPWGLYDVMGNVFERVDGANARDSMRESRVDPYTPGNYSGSTALKGGSLYSTQQKVRHAYITATDGLFKDREFGFRVVKNIPGHWDENF